MAQGLGSYLIDRRVEELRVVGEVMLVEPNGDEHLVSCIRFPDGLLEVTGEGDMMDYLNERYSPKAVSAAVHKSLG